MTYAPTPQHKIGTGFGARSTRDDVLRGTDLTGKLAVVTGGYVGLGLETTRALTRAGARVVVPARRREVAEKAVGSIDGAEVDQLDLADLDSVRDFADRFLASGRDIDIVVNNAGIMACPETRVGQAGWEAQFATNHLGHFALVNRLWAPIARGGARVVSVSSRGHHLSDIRWDDIHFQHGPYDKWAAYGQAKTANVLFAVHLDALGRESRVRAFALHPGQILTELVRHTSREERIERGWIDEKGNVSDTFKTPEQGAATQVWAATSELLDGMGGVYCEDCDIAEPALPGDDSWVGIRDYAIDPAHAARLWSVSAELTGVNAF
ncbi:SDR family NAD(P)-dependent oxidoreductase [Streptomyces sp. DG2A-72]|uniref:SDR family NAD(P)-dependent oxidoreductase n=1 Tax=Streptomyces sp. DG2A-72 TaxID=3051386 RepID=UPI00265BFD0B|nr:SDR family NAD(P)-dependent oxidoreductase [Streptomyces sp. DG2A-72]MDO0930228.1 SDR family NAD(P)-dependent oxidoreductase [Streptomyces sp. DG2A-72]